MSIEDKNLLLVIGNRSGDLDSLVSSYVKGKMSRLEISSDITVVSLFHIPFSEWKLHPEAILLFHRCRAELDDVLFLDKTQNSYLKSLSEANKLEIILTDHNYPDRDFSIFEKNIVEIIDHHKINNSVSNKIKVTISNTGSCSTLVAEQFFNKLAKKPALFDQQIINELANLLYFTIRIDTDHLAGNIHYDLKRDRMALKRLSSMISLPVGFTEDLKREKMNFSQFSLEDHFYKDYKSWGYRDGTYGISSVFKSIDDFTEEVLLESAIASFMKKKGIDILFLMHFLKKPILKRELTVTFSESCRFKNEILHRLNDSEYFMKLESSCKGDKLHFFSQENPDFSRKKIQPYIEKLLETLKD
jgi:inorganic pyrophosphatase/exopolyphosphatase